MTVVAGPRRRWKAPAVVGTTVLVVDQLTKWWASEVLADQTIDIFWTLRLRLVFNTGAAFSRGEGFGPILAVLVVVVIALLVRQGVATVDPV